MLSERTGQESTHVTGHAVNALKIMLLSAVLQVGIGICTKSSAEFGKRGELFWVELDFVLANVIMALIADFMLVWLPAPTVAFR